MGDAVQAVTTTQVDQAKFVTKKQARKLDRAREDYENLMEKAAKFEAKGKTDKLNRKNSKADAVMDKYEARAKAAGVTTPLEITKYEKVQLVEPGKVLSKEDKKLIEKFEKQLVAARKAGDDVQYATLLKGYEEARTRLGVPTLADITNAIYSNEDPMKAEELRKDLKKQLKDANMYFGEAEAALKGDITVDYSDAKAIENRVNANLAKGYIGVKKSTKEAFETRGLNPNEVSEIAKDAAGADNEFDRKSNERNRNYKAVNSGEFAEKFVQDNKDKTFAEVNKIKIGEREIDTKNIGRITLLSGRVLAPAFGDDISDIKLGEVRTIQMKGEQAQISFGAKEYQKGDAEYVKNKHTRRANKAIGYEYVKPNLLKAAGETALQMTPVAAFTALSPFITEFTDSFKFALNIKGDGEMTGSFLEDMVAQINKQLSEQMPDGGYTIDKTDKIVKMALENNFHVKLEHYCVGALGVSAAVALVSNMIEQLRKGEEVAPEKLYEAVCDKLTLEQRNNAAGGAGHTLGADEINAAIGEAMALLKELKNTPAPKQPVVEPKAEPKPEPPKPTATIVETYEKPEFEEAKYCVYNNKAGEYWSGIVQNTYKDENGNLVKDWNDVKEIYSHIRTLNGYKATDANMPKGVKMVKEFTTKSGKKYTYCCGEPENRTISGALPEDATQKEQAKKFGKPVANLNEGTQRTMTKPAEFSYHYDLSDDKAGNIDGEKAAGKDDVEKLDNNEKNIKAKKESLIKKGYDVVVKWWQSINE